jgi:hypothetical protein
MQESDPAVFVATSVELVVLGSSFAVLEAALLAGTLLVISVDVVLMVSVAVVGSCACTWASMSTATMAKYLVLRNIFIVA